MNKTFNGGYFFKLEGKPQDRVIELGLPSIAVIPLKQGFGREVKPLVKEGEKVKAGQIIGRDDLGISSPVHASVSGSVESLIKLESPQGSINAVVIKGDGTRDWQPLDGHNRDWQQLSREKIERLLYLSGVTSLDGKGIPTRFKTSSISNGEVEDLIIQGIEDSPYHLSLATLLVGERCNHLIEGIRMLRKIMPQANVHLAVNSKRQRLVEKLQSKTEDLDWLTVYALPPKYPQGNDQALARTILGDRVKHNMKRVVVLAAATLLQVHDAVVEGKPLIECMVALGGPGWKENIHLRVRIGTPVNNISSIYLQQAAKCRLVPNNLLTQSAITDLSLPVDRGFTSLAALPENSKGKKCSYSRTFITAFKPLIEQGCDTGMHGAVSPCIFCGHCEEVCPVGIIPHLLDKYAKRNLISKELIRYGIFDCVECNLCTFVCPSKIPVARHIKAGQQKLIDYGFVQADTDSEEEKTAGAYNAG